jgi:hypothetical protein
MVKEGGIRVLNGMSEECEGTECGENGSGRAIPHGEGTYNSEFAMCSDKNYQR